MGKFAHRKKYLWIPSGIKFQICQCFTNKIQRLYDSFNILFYHGQRVDILNCQFNFKRCLPLPILIWIYILQFKPFASYQLTVYCQPIKFCILTRFNILHFAHWEQKMKSNSSSFKPWILVIEMSFK